MIGLVRLALRRPYTMAIAGMLILLMGFLSAQRMVVDIFPNIDIPVVYVVWNYPGLSAEDMERRVVLVSERAYSTTVNGIERIESQSIPGIGILKVYFQPGTDIGGAIAQINAQNNSILRIAPPGMHAAERDPVQRLERAGRADHAHQQDAARAADLRLRPQLHPREAVHHSRACRSRRRSAASSGRSSSTSIPRELGAKGFSPIDVVNALQASNVIVPAGTARIGEREYNVQLNSSPQLVEQFNALPIGVSRRRCR